MFGGFEVSNAMTATPVPPQTALHQLHSVPPTVRPFGSVMVGGGWMVGRVLEQVFILPFSCIYS